MDFGAYGASVDVFINRVDCCGAFCAGLLGVARRIDDGVVGFFANCFMGSIASS